MEPPADGQVQPVAGRASIARQGQQPGNDARAKIALTLSSSSDEDGESAQWLVWSEKTIVSITGL